MADPVTAEEWQAAVDAAQGLMLLESARAYGLVTGGPDVDVQRCLTILSRGIARGFAPSPDAADRLLQELSS